MFPLKSALRLLLILGLLAGLAYYFKYQQQGKLQAGKEAGDAPCAPPPAAPLSPTTAADFDEDAPQCASSSDEAQPLADEQGLFNDALALLAKKQVGGAVASFMRIIAANPKHVGALTELAMIYRLDKDDARSALPYYERAYALQLNNDTLLSELVGTYAELNEMRQGVTALQELARQHPKQANLAFAIGKILVANARMSEAIPYLETAVKHERYDMGLPDLGYAYSQTGEKVKARQAFLDAIADEQEQYRQGVYTAKQEEGRQNLMIAYMNYASELYLQNELDKAAHIISSKILKLSSQPFDAIDDLF